MEQLLSPFAYAVSLVFFASGLRNLGLLRVRFRSMKVLKLKWIRCFVFASRPRTMRILGSLQCKIQWQTALIIEPATCTVLPDVSNCALAT